MWTIYDRPKDEPTYRYVARCWYIGPGAAAPTPNVMGSNDIEVLRERMRRHGLTRIERDPNDDPVILETWL